MLRAPLDLSVRAVAEITGRDRMEALRFVLQLVARGARPRPSLRAMRYPFLGLFGHVLPGTTVRVAAEPCRLWRVRTPCAGRPAAAVRVLYAHGGGMVSGSAWGHRAICSHLSHALGGAEVVAPNFRLLPEHTLKDAVDDIVAVLAWMARRRPRLPTACVACSGGAMALMLALRRPHPAAQAVRRALLLSPMADYNFRPPRPPPRALRDPLCPGAFIDLCCSTCRRRHGGEENPARADATRLPPGLALWVWVDEKEPLCAGARALVRRAARAGGGRRARLRVRRRAFHAWPVLCGLRAVPQLEREIHVMARFLRRPPRRGAPQ